MTAALVATPTRLNLVLYRGDSFAFTVSFTSDGAPTAVPEGPWKAQVRAGDGEVLTEFGVTVDELLVCSLTSEQVRALDLPPNHPRPLWDLQQGEAPGNVRTWFAGLVYVYSDVTHG